MADLHKSQQFQALTENEYLKEALSNIEQRAIEEMLHTGPDEDDLRWKTQGLVLAVRQLREEIESLKTTYAPTEKRQIDTV